MSAKKTAIIAGNLALVVPGAVLFLLWRYGVWKIMIGKTDLRPLLWPSSKMITNDWCNTVRGVGTTICSIEINCLLYIAIALVLRHTIQWIRSGQISLD